MRIKNIPSIHVSDRTDFQETRDLFQKRISLGSMDLDIKTNNTYF